MRYIEDSLIKITFLIKNIVSEQISFSFSDLTGINWQSLLKINDIT